MTVDYSDDSLFPTRGLIPEIDTIRDRKLAEQKAASFIGRLREVADPLDQRLLTAVFELAANADTEFCTHTAAQIEAGKCKGDEPHNIEAVKIIAERYGLAPAAPQEVVQPEEAEETPAAAIDLMAALKASFPRARQAGNEEPV